MGVLRRAGHDRFRVQQHGPRATVLGDVLVEQCHSSGHCVGEARVQRKNRRQLPLGPVRGVHQHKVGLAPDRHTVRSVVLGKQYRVDINHHTRGRI